MDGCMMDGCMMGAWMDASGLINQTM